MAIYLLPGADQLKAAKAIYETMERAKALFPPGMDYKIVYDTTPAVEASIHEILKTFVEALAATFPYYVGRLIGGVIFLVGMLVMAYNVGMTVRAAPPHPWMPACAA